MATQVIQTLSDAKMTRAHEKKELSVLNGRFASYIDKVRFLQESNAALEVQLKAAEVKAAPWPKEKYEEELRGLRAQVDELSKATAGLEVERNSWQAQAEEWQGKCEEQIAARTDIKAEIEKWKKELEIIKVARAGFETKLIGAQKEVAFVKQAHAEELGLLQAELNATLAKVESESKMVAGPDLSDSLREIREQYETIGRANKEDAEAKYRQKFSEMTQQRERDAEALKAIWAEVAELNKKISTLQAEAEGHKSKNTGLEGSLKQTEDRLQREIEEYKAGIRRREAQIEKMKTEVAKHLIDYQELMNVKMALDIEIAAYRKLIEGEETRLKV